MSRRVATQIAAAPSKHGVVLFALANDGTVWQSVKGKWELCAALPQNDWGSGQPPEQPAAMPPNTWGSQDPPNRTEGLQ